MMADTLNAKPEAVGSKIFKVDGFRNPSLAADRREHLEAIEAEPLDMSAQAVLDAAKATTGLDDFGPMDFVERLELLLGEVEANANLWKSAKKQFIGFCVKAASNRLRNQAYLSANPETADIVIDRPIIIVGLPRSGTTHLENLIAADRRLRYLPVYLGSEATPTPGESVGPDGKDPRWLRSNAHWDRMKGNAIMAAMHEHSPDHACGENELQMPDFSTYQWEWMAEVPRWRDYYLSHDQTPHYAYGKRILQAVAHQYPSERRWIMKGNQHSEQLPALNAVYPDAIFVQTHRDPLAILQSVLTMRGLSVLANQKSPDIEGHVTYWVDRIEKMLRAYMRDMEVIPAGRRIDLMFQDIMADDIGTAQHVLAAAGLTPSQDSVADMRHYMDTHPRGRDGRVVYDLAGDFNLDLEALRKRFSFYTDRFPVKHEVRP
ncbi:sulfotransferase [Sphingobium sp. MP9-4]|uniref:sulfotransferase family protein n=1 Tax=Sphingobium sp. MP9-4 TaxID=1761936 RepID=UPI001F0D7AA5|nr:sulfotransferase [Sphingobium sp. MP9-4]